MPAASLSSAPVQYTVGIRQTDVSFVSKFRGQYRNVYSITRMYMYIYHTRPSVENRTGSEKRPADTDRIWPLFNYLFYFHMFRPCVVLSSSTTAHDVK